jgi:AcrR family transcriptional regulator
VSTPRRAYRSQRRAQDAATTRNDILAAAAELFTDKGYGRVTVADIARQAGVAQKTVYASAGSKADILNELIASDVANSGAVETLAAVLRTSDLRQALDVVAHGTRMGNETHQESLDIIYAAMSVHDDAEALWERSTGVYRAVLLEIATHLAGRGVLREDAARAADVLWFCFGPGSWRILVKGCGWSWDDAERWLADQSFSMLARSA